VSEPSRPPPGTTPALFFQSWLPEAVAAAGRLPAADAPVVEVSLSGPGGGARRVHAGEGGLEVTTIAGGARPRGDDDAEVILRQSVADFAAAFTRDLDLPELLPGRWSALDLLFLDPRDVALVRQMAGRILLEVSGQRRRRWALDAAFGKEGRAAGRPRATIQIDGPTYEGLRTGTLAPMQALLAGKIKVDGDRALAGRALLLVGARLSRG
jgi:SCP-2 sterol transfer family protein